MTGTVYVVDCVDTEGPLYESLDATFDRLRQIFGIDLPPQRDTLQKLQNREMDLGGLEDAVAEAFNPHNQTYFDTWDKVDVMLDEIMSSEFGYRQPDSFGGGWVFNWFCLDHVGYDINPRRRDMGYHNIFDHYARKIRESGVGDQLYFHYHPVDPSRSAHKLATQYLLGDDRLFQILARRIIDRNWFPAANRPGFHVTRPDSHWFLEQYIPFDFGNESAFGDLDAHNDLKAGRFGDWRRAPRTWQPYHPSHDDYQQPGQCRRWISRCLQIGGRSHALKPPDVDQAFQEAADGQPVILAFSHHDFRDMREEVHIMQAMISEAAARRPEVSYRYCDAREAFRRALGLDSPRECDLKAHFLGDTLFVSSDRGVFGPQPFLAYKTKAATYAHDNFTIHQPFRAWSYTFDDITMPRDALSKVGVAASDEAGNVAVVLVDPCDGLTTTTHW